MLVAPSAITEAQTVPAPFGIKMGAKKGELGPIRKELPDFMVALESVPKPHPDLESYVVQVTPQAGVCFVKGIGKTISTSVYGTEIKSNFNSLRDQLESVYGRSKSMDTLLPNSIWNEPKDFMMGLLKKERILAARWSTKDGLQLKPGITSVFLGVSALSQEKAYAVVEYYFDNTGACEAEVNAAKKAVF
jgi:hypothetical protein